MNTRRFLVILVLIVSGILSGCSGQPPAPTITPTTAATMTPTTMPTTAPTMTPNITPTPLPPVLTDGKNSWPVVGISFVNTAKIEGYTRPAKKGMVYLLVEFKNLNGQLPSFPSLPRSQLVDYSQIYVTDSLGEKYLGVNNGVNMVSAGGGGFTLGDYVAIFFQAMPEGTHGFRLSFLDLPVVDLGNMTDAKPNVLPENYTSFR